MKQHETLRMIAEHSAPAVAEALISAADRLELLEQQAAYIDVVFAWQAEGERLFEGGVGLMFSLGEWWADRPWRKDRCNTNRRSGIYQRRPLEDGKDNDEQD